MQSQSLAPKTDAFALKTDDLSVYIHLANYRGWVWHLSPPLGPACAHSTHENAATHLLQPILSRSPKQLFTPGFRERGLLAKKR
jgi:hypothetical protein